MDDTSLPVRTSDINADSNGLKLYRKRWLVLTIFTLNGMMNSVLWFSLSSINDIAVKYYKVNPSTVDLVANTFVLGIVLFALPWAYFTRSWGLRPTIITASSLTAIGSAFHYAGSHRNGFLIYLLGQFAASASQSPFIQVAPDLSATWFGPNERSLATCISLGALNLGVGIGFLQPTYTVPQTDDMKVVEQGMKNMNLTQLCISVVLLLMVYLFFEEKPPTPPSISRVIVSEAPDMPFTTSLKILAKDIKFHILLQSLAICNGMSVILSTFLNELIVKQFPKGHLTLIGWMGFSYSIVPVLTTILFGFLVNKYHTFRSVASGTMLACLALTIAFFVVLLKTHAFIVLFIVYTLLGAFGVPFLATGMEQAAELTYPVPEGTSGAVIMMVGNIYTFVMVLALGFVIEKGNMLLLGGISVGFYLLATILAACVKTDLKRSNIERDVLDYQPTVES